MNAQIAQGFSFHGNTNRNGHHLVNFIKEHNLIVGNISFQKHVNKLWTHRPPKGNLSQIDFVMYRKRWRNNKHILHQIQSVAITESFQQTSSNSVSVVQNSQ